MKRKQPSSRLACAGTIAVILCLLPCLAGCSNKVPVSGKVTYQDGTPLNTGAVFMGNGLNTYYGDIQKDGTFSLGILRNGEGIPPGSYKVWVGAAEVAPGSDGRRRHALVNKKYESGETSGLTYKAVKGKSPNFDIVVEKP